MVVHGMDGLDEITLNGETMVAEVRDRTVRLFRIQPTDAGLSQAPLAALAGGDAERNAAILEKILRGEAGPRRDIVLLNAAAALCVSGLAENFTDGVRLGAETIDAGAALRLLTQLREFKLDIIQPGTGKSK
jgi:anthranilate phosphoribosyltransferase